MEPTTSTKTLASTDDCFDCVSICLVIAMCQEEEQQEEEQHEDKEQYEELEQA